MSETFANLINQEPEPLSRFAENVPPELQRIVAKMLRKNADDRYQTMRDIFTDMREFRDTLTAGSKLERPAGANGEATAYMDAATGGGARHFTVAATLEAFSRSIVRHKPLSAFLSIGLIVGILSFGNYFYAPKSGAISGKRSIAVLPVRPLNAAARDELYEIGIADTLIHNLGTLKGLIVRPLKATRRYAETEYDPIDVGREEQVDYVLASRYQVADGRIRITGQLLNVASGQIEDTYKTEVDLGSIFAIQDAVAGEVRRRLQARFAVPPAGSTAVPNRGTSNEEAYRLYLQGMHLVEKETLIDAKRAMELFDAAIKVDPSYSKAWAGKARAHCLYAHVGGDSPNVQFMVAKPALQRAFQLDSDSAEAHVVLAIIEADYHWNFAEAEKHFLRAIELSPNSDIFYRWYATRLAGRGRYDEAFAMARTAIDINPNYVNHQLQYGKILYSARRFDEAITQMQRVLEVDASFPLAYSVIYRSHHAKGDGPRAYEALMKLLRRLGTNDDVLNNYEALYAKGGWQKVLSQTLEDLKARNTNGSSAFTIATLSALLGQRDQAFHYLNEALNTRSMDIAYIYGDPAFDLLRGDPRFTELENRIAAEAARSVTAGN